MLGALMLLGTGIQAAGQLYAGNAAAANAEMNASIMRQNAAIVRSQGARNEEALRRKQSMFLAEQRASFQQTGVDAGSGSAADIQRQSEVLAELDVMTQRYETEMRALGLMTQANATEKYGEAQQTAGYLGAAGSLLSGAADYQMLKPGV